MKVLVLFQTTNTAVVLIALGSDVLKIGKGCLMFFGAQLLVVVVCDCLLLLISVYLSKRYIMFMLFCYGYLAIEGGALRKSCLF